MFWWGQGGPGSEDRDEIKLRVGYRYVYFFSFELYE